MHVFYSFFVFCTKGAGPLLLHLPESRTMECEMEVNLKKLLHTATGVQIGVQIGVHQSMRGFDARCMFVCANLMNIFLKKRRKEMKNTQLNENEQNNNNNDKMKKSNNNNNKSPTNKTSEEHVTR